MAEFKSPEWFSDLKVRANRNEEFQKAAKWFRGTIGWRILDEGYRFVISEGQVKAIEPGLEGAVFTVAGGIEEWKELLTKGTLNRLFRQNRIRIDGDRVEAMRYWKVLWYLTEVGRSIK
jgi:hypothetical protein